jgi:ppGpp synthetase/RelA/SpoT-type nucleotidyltranferase
MAYEKPPASANQIDKSGKNFFSTKLSTKARSDAVALIRNWRAAHSYPLNALHMTLRNRAKRLDVNADTGQRLKRLESIIRKLSLRPTMQLSQMQDIGGCRAIVANVNRLWMLETIYELHPLRHELSRTRDYINDPKDDGYRSIHRMYRFTGKATSLPWNKLRIEIQMRTKLQHAWATCVETVDAFTGQDLKFGGGSTEWRRFFQLMGAVHARIEKTSPIPGTPSDERKLKKEVRQLELELQVMQSLQNFAQVTAHITGPRGKDRDWFLLEMLPEEGRVLVTGFPLNEFNKAKLKLAEAEKEYEGTKNQAVLVATSSLSELRRAYPNYFADTVYFTSVLGRFLNP